MRTKRRAVFANPKHCHICGLPIPQEIVSPRHALFGTVDHVIPLSKGGPNNWRNCAPAHWMCNRTKADRTLDARQRRKLFLDVLDVLRVAGFTLTKQRVKGCAVRAGIDLTLTTEPRDAGPRTVAKGYQLSRWEDDGGGGKSQQARRMIRRLALAALLGLWWWRWG